MPWTLTSPHPRHPPLLYATTKINVTTSSGDAMQWTLTSPPSVCHNEDQRNNIFWWRNIQGTFTSPAYVYQRERLKVPPCSGEPQASPLQITTPVRPLSPSTRWPHVACQQLSRSLPPWDERLLLGWCGRCVMTAMTSCCVLPWG